MVPATSASSTASQHRPAIQRRAGSASGNSVTLCTKAAAVIRSSAIGTLGLMATSQPGSPRPGIDAVPSSSRFDPCAIAITAYRALRRLARTSSSVVATRHRLSAAPAVSQNKAPRPSKPRGCGCRPVRRASSKCSSTGPCCSNIDNCCWASRQRDAGTSSSAQRGTRSTTRRSTARRAPPSAAIACHLLPTRPCSTAGTPGSSTTLPSPCSRPIDVNRGQRSQRTSQ